MKSIFFLSLTFFILTSDSIVNWELKPGESVVNFTIKNFGKVVHGTIQGMKAEIVFDTLNPESSKIEASIDVNTINTGISKRDKDIKTDKYFDVEKFPRIKFKSSKIKKGEKGYRAFGALTIKDVTKDVEIPFSFKQKGKRGVFRGNLTIDRVDYHVGDKSRIMGEEVQVEIIAVVESSN